jgi:hypothetical protein
MGGTPGEGMTQDDGVEVEAATSIEEAAAETSRPIPPRVLVDAVLRAAAFVVVLLVLYAIVPLNESTGTTITVVVLCSLGLVVFGIVFIRRLRAITRSDYPLVTAGESLIEVLAVFVVLFAMIHLAIADAAPGSYSEPLDRLDAVYFAVTVLTTVGFGDISPVSSSARLATTIQMLADLFLIAAAARVIIGVARRSDARRQAQAGPRDASAG